MLRKKIEEFCLKKAKKITEKNSFLVLWESHENREGKKSCILWVKSQWKLSVKKICNALTFVQQIQNSAGAVEREIPMKNSNTGSIW